jgi:glycosyltransferase involved in cell wall biosynthesis
MLVGVDATAFGNRHGDGRFARNVVRRLVELDSQTRYVLFLDESEAARAELPAGAEVCTLALGRTTTAYSARPTRDLLRLTWAASSRRCDALLYPSLVSWFPVMRTPSVVGLHDANVARFGPAVLPRRRARLLWRIKQSAALHRAARVFTVSETAARDLREHLGLDAGRVEVVPPAADPVFRPRDEIAARRRTAPLGPIVAGAFLLYAGGINPHKGVETLVDAYAKLRVGGRPSPPPLVLVGALDDDEAHTAAPSVRERIERHRLGEHVLLPGFVDDETLASLYSTATVVVATSHGEGFGLCPVEAAACGAPVVLSDIPSHRATLGHGARYFPPGDSGALAQTLEELLLDPTLHRALAERARRGVSSLSWDRAAATLGRLVADAAATGRR